MKINLGATPLDALYVGATKVYPPPVVKPELPGLGGWADITAVTGNPTKHQYKDAAGA